MCGGANDSNAIYTPGEFDPLAGYTAQMNKRDMDKYGMTRTNVFESDKEFFKRIGKQRQAEMDAMSDQRNAIMEQQRSESQRLQTQMVQQQEQHSKDVAGLQTQQAEKVSGIRSRGQSVVSSLRILGQQQPMAPTASQTASRPGSRGAASTQANVARGSARSRGTNLSI